MTNHRDRPGASRTPDYAPIPPRPRVHDRIADRYSTPPASARSDLFGALVVGLGGVVLVALIWLVAAGALGLTWGLLGVAVIGGWLVGSMVGWGAWNRSGPRRTHMLARLLAVGLGLLAWLAGTYLAYLWKLSVSAKSGEPLLQRLAEQDFQRWLPSQFGLMQILQLAIIGIVAWWSSR